MDTGSNECPSDEQKWALVQELLRGEVSAAEVRERHGLSESELGAWVQSFRDAAREAIDEEMQSALARQGVGFQAAKDGEISGNVEGMAVAELIQTLEYGRRDALIRVDHHGRQSHVWVLGGEVIDARSGALSGSAAVYRLLGLRAGRFYAAFGPIERSRTIDASTQALLIESAKRFDECRALREQLGDCDAELVPAQAGASLPAGLEPIEEELLSAFAGGASVERVVLASRFPDLEALAALVKLRQRGSLIPKSAGEVERSTTLPSQRRPSIELSVTPLAASLRARGTERARAPYRPWVSVAAGIAVVSAAFAVGFFSARGEAVTRSLGARQIRMPPLAADAHEGCPSGLLRVPSGPLLRAGVRDPSRAPELQGRNAELGAFCLSPTEVSVKDYGECVNAGACGAAHRDVSPSAEAADEVAVDTQPGCNTGQPGRELHSVNCVSAQQAAQYCSWRELRLPTVAEWARAAESAPNLYLGSGLAEWTADRIGLPSSGRPAPGEERQPLHAVLAGTNDAGQLARSYMPATSHATRVGFRCAVAAAPITATAASP